MSKRKKPAEAARETIDKAKASALRAEKLHEKRFVEHYARWANGALAVRLAYPGYAAGEEHAGQERFRARDLLTKRHVQAAVVVEQKRLGELHFNIHNEMIRDLHSMSGAMADVSRIYDADGNVLDPKDWPDDLKGCIAGIEIEEHMTGEGDAVGLVRTKKVKLASRVAVIGALAKITGHVIDKKQLVDKDGNPVDPLTPAAPIFNITVGTIAVPPPEPPQEKKK